MVNFLFKNEGEIKTFCDGRKREEEGENLGRIQGTIYCGGFQE